MNRYLKRVYFSLAAPAAAGFLIAWPIKITGPPEWGRQLIFAAPVAESLFVAAAILSIAFPIYYRSWFAHRNRREKRVPERALLKFERNLIVGTMITPYLALTACVLPLPRFHLAAIALMGLYAAYYFYPSERRIAFERRIFRAGQAQGVGAGGQAGGNGQC